MRPVKRWLFGALVMTASSATLACENASTMPPGGAAAGGRAGSGGEPEPTQPLPCDVERVLAAKCQRCHAAPPMNGAPFPLRTWADTQQDFGTPVWRKMQVQIENGTMPLTSMSLTPPVEDLTAEERQTLLEWFDAGAPPGASACP